jgi:transcription initiation factor TFIIIB Brf1 subunit/transcription initiation factor TFIIB
MSAVSGFETKDIGRIHMQIREKLGISVNTITIGDFMPRFCLNLGKDCSKVTMRKQKKINT